MANINTNGSYDRCMAEFRARYIGRGVSVSAKRTAALDSSETKEEMSFRGISSLPNEYRSGSYNGSRYMTSDDFIRYFRNRAAYNMPLALKKTEALTEVKANDGGRAVAARGRSSRTGGIVRSDSTSKEGNLITKAQTFAAKWFPVEPREGREKGDSFKFPARAIASMAAFAMSLMLIVGGSVMVGNASGEVGKLNTKISRLEARETELESELDMKYSIQDIEKEAAELGMIKNEYADKEYLEVSKSEKIEIFDNEEKQFGISALLSAFGIDID